MKKHFTKLMAVILSMCMMVTTAGIASAFDDIPEDVPEVSSGEESGAVLPDDTFAGDWQLKVDEASNVKYWELDAIYVKNPTEGITTSSDDGLVQHIKVWAPEAYIKDGVLNKDGKVVSSTGLVYTAENAPIVYRNHSGGYTSSKINGVDIDYIVEGCVYSEIQTRGKEIQNKEGKYIGQFPVLIADMKAGIRFLRYFDSVLPGDSERIVSTGHSSGGAVSAMLGASGDSKIFDPYLEEIGAYEASDAIWIAHASAPITNLSSADASYEWYQTSNPTYFLFNSMAVDREGNPIENFPVGPQNKYPLGSNVLGGAHEDELSAILYDDFVDYVQGMGLDLGDDGRSGEFYEGFIEIYEDALAEYIARFDELKAAGAQAVASAPATAAEYLASLDKAGTGWVKYDEATGKMKKGS